MSRTFFLKEEMESRGPANADAEQSKSLSGLADAISGLDREVLNEVALDVATPEEIRSNDELLKIKLEVLQKENELIDTEFVARQAAKKKEEKERTEKERMEKKAVEEEQAEEKEAEEKEPGAEERFVPSEAEKTDFVHDGTAAVEEFDAPTEVFEDSRQLLEKTDGTTLAPPPAPAAETAVPEPEVAAEDDDDEAELSTEEIEALTHILTSDPVLKEREELARIKAAIAQDEENDEDEAAEDREEGSEGDPPSSPPAADAAGDGVEPGPEAAATEAPAESGAEDGNARLEHAIDKLSAKVRTMVDGIEEQLGEAELRIGDRLHLLDRDLDGILSRQEVEGVLQDVLKRKLTEQEASEIAREIDTDEDGRITVDELNKWCQMKRISKLVEVGRDVDNDMANMKEMDDEQAEAEATAKDSNDRETTAK
uniref:EF-hand domain-containing protein n=1 Tax=Corethron hystrix TaxID=216773 RepID=A0A7S1BV52_9STRA